MTSSMKVPYLPKFLSSLEDIHFQLILGFLPILIYWNSLGGSFIWDDRAAILGNKDVLGINPWSSMLKNDFWGQPMYLHDSHKSFRPFTIMTYRLDHYIYGLNSVGFHLTNVLLYAVTCIVMYRLTLQWMSVSGARLAAVLFLVHPVHVEAVTSIVGRADCLCGLFFFLSMYLYTMATRSVDLFATFNFVGAVVSGIVSSLSKEVGITVFAILVGIELLENLKPVILKSKYFKLIKMDSKDMNMRSGYFTKQSLQISFNIILKAIDKTLKSSASMTRIIIVAATLVIFFVLRLQLHGEHTLYRWTIMENHVTDIPSFTLRALSYGQTHAWYAIKLVYPRYLCFDYGFDCIPTILSIFDLRNILPAVVYSLYAALLVNALRSLRITLLLGLATLTVPLLPALNIVMPVGTLLAERLLFVPSLGFCLLVSEFFCSDLSALWESVDTSILSLHDYVLRKDARPKTQSQAQTQRSPSVSVVSSLLLVVTPILISCGMRVWSRNKDWQSEVKIYGSALSVCPRSLKALSNYAMLISSAPDGGRVGLETGLTAIEIYQNHTAAMVNVGLAYNKLGDHLSSVAMLERARLNPASSQKVAGYLGSSLYALAQRVNNDAEVKRELFEQSLFWIDHGIESGFSAPSILHQAGSIAMELNLMERAVRYYRYSLSQALHGKKLREGSGGVPIEDDTNEIFTYNQLGVCLQKLQRNEEAREVFLAGLQIDPANIALVSNLAILYREIGQFEQARELLRRVTNKPDAPAAILNNLGSLEVAVGNFEAALAHFERALLVYRTAKSPTFIGKDGEEHKYQFDGQYDNAVETIILNNIEDARKKLRS